MTTPSEFSALSRPDKIRAVIAWSRANAHLSFASREAARACAEHFGAPFNTVRGLFQSSRSEEEEATLPADADEIKPIRDRVADAAAGREAARQPRPPKRRKRYLIDDDGMFQPAREGEPLHVCPTCKATAHTHYELLARWGIRKNKRTGSRRPQSLCTPCRTAHGRQRRKKQIDIVDVINAAATASAPDQPAMHTYQNPTHLNDLLGGRL